MANDNALFTTKIRNLIICAGKILHFPTTNLQTGTASDNSTLKCHYLLSHARPQTKSQEKKNGLNGLNESKSSAMRFQKQRNK